MPARVGILPDEGPKRQEKEGETVRDASFVPERVYIMQEIY
jgi:hypothetical protein